MRSYENLQIPYNPWLSSFEMYHMIMVNLFNPGWEKSDQSSIKTNSLFRPLFEGTIGGLRSRFPLYIILSIY